ncbi:MAG TPA: PP2C family protein-serine/threonine phosphatase [Anaerolineae bacterium]|nr:PP2C family protein-serine/threonine phosphatase [Anaerolineae bacterium]
MELGTHSYDKLSTFVAQQSSLLDALASVWTQLGCGEFSWRDETGRVLYGAGLPARDGLRAPLLGGALSVASDTQALHSLLTAQADLLAEVFRREGEMDLLTDELMRTTDQLVALYEVSAAARDLRDVEDVMRACLEQAARLTGAKWSMLLLHEPGREAAGLRLFGFPSQTVVESDIAERVLAPLAAQRDPLIANSREECISLLGPLPESVVRVACAPFSIGDRPAGALCAVNKPADFISGDLKLLAALADAAAGFLERERSHQRELDQARVQRELEIAAEIQSHLLPREVPTVPGAQVAARSQPASEVGGDFFDVQVLPGGMLALALGDTAGKGVPAALFAAMAHGILRAGLHSMRSPGEAVRQLNARLAADLSNADMLLTLFVAIYDPGAHKLSLVNCGQAPVLCYRRGAVELWEADGPPVGVLLSLLSVEHEHTLESGDVLVVLSDGFSEARNAAGERLGITPLIEVIEQLAGREAPTIVEALQQMVNDFGRGGPQRDDQTLIVMKVE